MAAAQEEIITKEKGSQKVKSEGIDPFLNFINSGARDFFSAQVFVTLYESVPQQQPRQWRSPGLVSLGAARLEAQTYDSLVSATVCVVCSSLIFKMCIQVSFVCLSHVRLCCAGACCPFLKRLLAPAFRLLTLVVHCSFVTYSASAIPTIGAKRCTSCTHIPSWIICSTSW